MESSSQLERQIRAARNQSLFRAVNERMTALNDAFAPAVLETFVIACECADLNCIETLEILPDDYRGVRADPRHFAVLAGHVYAPAERVVREAEQYVVVEKLGAAAEVAEALTPMPEAD